MLNRENKGRDLIAIVFLTAVCGLAIWQKMEMLAIFALAGIGALVFKHWMTAFLNILRELVEESYAARIGSVELQARKEDYSTKLSSHPV